MNDIFAELANTDVKRISLLVEAAIQSDGSDKALHGGASWRFFPGLELFLKHFLKRRLVECIEQYARGLIAQRRLLAIFAADTGSGSCGFTTNAAGSGQQ